VPDLRRGGKSKNTGNAAHVMKPFQNLANTTLCACLWTLRRALAKIKAVWHV